jgi:hypothetical protein
VGFEILWLVEKRISYSCPKAKNPREEEALAKIIDHH